MGRFAGAFFAIIFAVPLIGQTVTAVRVEKAENAATGKVIATVDGNDAALPTRGVRAWMLSDGSGALYTTTQGRGGPGSDGQSLQLWDAKTGKTRLLAAESMAIIEIKEVRLKDGTNVFVMNLSDPAGKNVGTAATAVQRSTFWRMPMALCASVDGTVLTLNEYTAAQLKNGGDPLQVTPKKTSTVDIDANYQADATARAEKKAAKKKP
jgi:hypothetical protein